MDYQKMYLSKLRMSGETKLLLAKAGFTTVQDLFEQDIYDSDIISMKDRFNLHYGLVRAGMDATDLSQLNLLRTSPN